MATTSARALVAPASTATMGSGQEEGGNENNLAANARVRCVVGLEPLLPEGRGELQRVEARLPNWLRIVLYSAGTNYSPAESLPAQIEVPVLLEAGGSRIASLDVDATAAELAQYHEVARRHWLETEAALAPVRSAVKLPGAALRGARGFLSSWRDALKDRPATPEEVEQMRRTAVMQRHYWAKHPKERDKYRASVLDIRAEMVRGTKAGVRAESDLVAWIDTHEIQEILTAEEAAELRREAGLP